MKRKIVLLMLLCFTVMGINFVAARGKQDSSDAGKVTAVRVWTNSAHDKIEFDATFNQFNQTVGAQNNVRIEYTVYGGDYQTALDVAIQASEEPEIYRAYPKTSQYIQMGKLVPLSELPDFQTILNEFEPFQKEGLSKFNGVVYALPLYQYVFGMNYNKDLLSRVGFSAPPKTWDEFERATIAISKLEPGKVFGTGFPCKYTNYHENFIMNFAIPTTGRFQFDPISKRYVYSDLVPFFEMINRIRQGGGMFPGMENLDDDTLRAQFAEGNIGMIFGGSWNVGVLYDQFPAKIPWEVAAFPVRDISKSYNGVSTTSLLMGISSKCRDAGILDKVARVYKVLASKELAQSTYSAGKNIPINTAFIQGAPPSDRPQWNTYAVIGANAVPRPTYPDADFVVEGDSMYTTFTKIVTGAAAPVATLADLDRRYNAALDRAVANKSIDLNAYIDTSIPQKFSYGR
jgi:multiple sugar transport system substrate-binding protein